VFPRWCTAYTARHGSAQLPTAYPNWAKRMQMYCEFEGDDRPVDRRRLEHG
jgi:hypothetical protein